MHAIIINASGEMVGPGVSARYVTAKNISIKNNIISIDRTVEPYLSVLPARIADYLAIYDNTENPITDITIENNTIQGFVTNIYYGYVYHIPYTLGVAGARSTRWFNPLPLDFGQEVLLATSEVSFTGADEYTAIFTVPDIYRCILTKVVVVGGADAGTTHINIGQFSARSDFINDVTLSNIDAQYDSAILMPIPADPPAQIKSYDPGTVIGALITNKVGGENNKILLYGILYE